MTQFCAISFRFCTGAPKYLVAHDNVLIDWTFDLSKARQYNDVFEADPFYQWIVDCFKGGKPNQKISPAVLAPLHNNRFSLIELAIERLGIDSKKTDCDILRRVHVDLLSLTRKAIHVLPDTYHSARTPPSLATHQPRREVPRAELSGSLPKKRSVGV